jgi:hypothetical protein
MRETYKQEGIVNGVKVDPDLVNKASQLQRIVEQLGPDVSYESLNRVRRVWDAKVAKAGGYAGQTLAEGSMVDAMREGANAIRSELAKDRPDIAKLNSEYSLWSKVKQVVGDTMQRRAGQEGNLMPKLAGISQRREREGLKGRRQASGRIGIPSAPMTGQAVR